jgi:hypothetical protein
MPGLARLALHVQGVHVEAATLRGAADKAFVKGDIRA